jgi:hypothetical protein
LRQRLEPVREELRTDPATGHFLERLETIVAGVGAAA